MFTKNFDFAYYPPEWEFTCDANDLSPIEEFAVEDAAFGTIVEIATLIKGPAKYCARVPVTFDSAGDPDEMQIKWFDTRKDAEAAFTSKPKQ